MNNVERGKLWVAAAMVISFFVLGFVVGKISESSRNSEPEPYDGFVELDCEWSTRQWACMNCHKKQPINSPTVWVPFGRNSRDSTVLFLEKSRVHVGWCLDCVRNIKGVVKLNWRGKNPEKIDPPEKHKIIIEDVTEEMRYGE